MLLLKDNNSRFYSFTNIDYEKEIITYGLSIFSNSVIYN